MGEDCCFKNSGGLDGVRLLRGSALTVLELLEECFHCCWTACSSLSNRCSGCSRLLLGRAQTLTDRFDECSSV